MSLHQTKEGHRIKGAGVKIHRDTARRQVVIVVDEEEMQGDTLIRVWVEALERSAETAEREMVLRSRDLL